MGVVGATTSVTRRIIRTTTLTDVASRVVGTATGVTRRIIRTTTLADVAGRIIGTTASMTGRIIGTMTLTGVTGGILGLDVVGTVLREAEHRRRAGDADGAGTGQHCGEGDTGDLHAELRGLLH
jgi:hypothetical protein